MLRASHRATRCLPLFPCDFLPAFAQTAVKEIPEHVEHDLRGSTEGVVDGPPNADVGQNVLAPAERDLHLRHDVPIRFRSSLQIPVGQEFNHWSPDTAETLILSERFS